MKEGVRVQIYAVQLPYSHTDGKHGILIMDHFDLVSPLNEAPVVNCQLRNRLKNAALLSQLLQSHPPLARFLALIKTSQQASVQSWRPL